MKRYFSLVLILAMLMSILASCSSKSDQADFAQDGNTSADTAISEDLPNLDETEEVSPHVSMEMPDGAAPADEYDGGGNTTNTVTSDLKTEDMSDGEEYDMSPETGFLSAQTDPLSTFSADVDTASYSNMRRQIMNGNRPDGVRVEELVNYFSYDYDAPSYDSEVPFSVTTEVAKCPWNSSNALAMVGIAGKRLNSTGKISNNVVFLIDVSGSMVGQNKLGLLQESFKMMLANFDKNDVISIVTYAGSDSIVADSVKGDERVQLAKLIGDLEAGGSTAGHSAIQTAYNLAEKNYIEGGNNRIILATDGDFNVGPYSDDEMKSLLESEKDKGIFISVLGFGMGNLKDSKMETIADNGNGNYAYIDTIAEAKKVLVDEFDSTMFTIAKDVKFQVEFNPAVVKEYRLIGYNNRRLANKDFDDDTKDAGEIGSGHSVTAFYELVLVNSNDGIELKYQDTPENTSGSTDFCTVKLRYKRPREDESKLIEHVVTGDMFKENPSEDFIFGSSVAEFGLILTNSEHKADSDTQNVIKRAGASLGSDEYGLRKEFLEIVTQYQKYLE